MSITDELRKWKGNIQTCLAPEVVLQLRCELTAIADRIDAEYQKAIRELNNLADASVLLPVDADGVPIHIGDSVEIIGGEYGAAVAIELCEDGGWNVSMRPTGWDTPTLFAAEYVRHHHTPTVEDVLREFTDEVWNRCCEGATASDSGIDELVAEYAAKLRLANDGEEQ